MNRTPRLDLPLLSAGQAQKEITHNEALVLIDALAQPVVREGPRATPPSDPVPGDCVLIDVGASDEFSGFDGSVAIFTDGGWRIVDVGPDYLYRERGTGRSWKYDEEGWSEQEWEASAYRVDGVQVVGPQMASIDDPSGGSVTDIEARTAISLILTALRSHGLISV